MTSLKMYINRHNRFHVKIIVHSSPEYSYIGNSCINSLRSLKLVKSDFYNLLRFGSTTGLDNIYKLINNLGVNNADLR